MILRLFRKLKSLGDEDQSSETIIKKSNHHISRDSISCAALEVIDSLEGNGFKAFIVGGAVRDLLLGFTPKDFDIATDATPEEVKQVFHRAKIIGRRFRLVHLYFGRDIVEISTFRAAVSQERSSSFIRDPKGRIIRDNVFGSQQEDALRRDFSVNALFYSPSKELVLDYCYGYRDLREGKLRIIGVPHIRFREDPVRILRAVRFSCQLNLKIDQSSLASMRIHKTLLLNVPRSRLFEETVKILFSGSSAKAFISKTVAPFIEVLIPEIKIIFRDETNKKFVLLAFTKTDERVKNNKPNSPAFVFAAIFWPQILASWEKNLKTGIKSFPALMLAVEVFWEKRKRVRLEIPRRFGQDMTKIWIMQARFQKTQGRLPHILMRSQKFRAGYDFMALRAESGETEDDLVVWWARFQRVSQRERQEMTKSKR